MTRDRVLPVVSLFALVLQPAALHASEGQLGHRLPVWSIIPFVAMLLAIALLPLVAPRWWNHNKHRALVSLALGSPVALSMGLMDFAALVHTAHEYLAFIILLGALFVISGGIVIRGTLAGTPGVNTLLLLIGGVLASFIGTTGASMLLIRPLLRANATRQRRVHVVVFFIFLVANIGGLLTPLGDPPLFLGFLRGVPFLWTFALVGEWTAMLATILALFLLVDTIVYRRENRSQTDASGPKARHEPVPIQVVGKINFLYLAGVVLVIFCSGQFHLPAGLQEAGMIACALLSLRTTPQALRQENDFSWEPIVEVAVVFAGIFATMTPALALLNAHGAELGLDRPWQYFWATGILSSFLDNAPTYLTFTATASGLLGTDANALQELLLSEEGTALLRAISLGAVFMGANTYIGNGPNFMVKAIAEQSGVRMPSFFGYMGYSTVILGPLFVLVTLAFLR